MSIFIPGGKAGGGGLESFWYDSTIAYPKDAYIYYWDFERPDWVTMYRNKSGADTAPGPFDPLLWERRGSFNDTPWSMEYAQTGLVHGGKVSQTGGPLQYKVEAGNGIIFGSVKTDGTSDTINVSWQETINTADFRLSSTIYLFIDRNGNINTLNNPPPPSSYRSMIYLGVVVQDPLNANQIGGITFAPYANYISQQTMQDLHRRLFTPCMDAGHVDVKPKSLKLSHGILRFYSYTSNWETDVNDPHMQSIQPVDPIQFTEVDSGFNVIRNNVTDIDPTNWEDSGTVKPLPANDKVTIHRLFYSITLQKYFLQVGQNVYDTIGDARESFQSENYNYAKPLTSMANAIIIAYIIIRKDTTTLDDGNKCEVKNGGCSFASGASSAIEYLKDLLDTNIIPPLKTDQHLSFSTTSNVWENKFPNPFVRYYEQKAKNDVVEMDAVYFDDINGEWKKAIADDVTNRKFAQGIAVNIQPLMITPVTPPGSPPATPIASTTNVRIDVVLFGVLTINAHGFDVGSTYYLSDTVPGGVTKTAPTDSRSFKQSIFTVLDNNDLLISSSSESFENNIIKNPLTNQKNVIEPDSDVNPLTIKQIAGAQEDPLTIESSLANYKFSVDGKFIFENSTTSPAIKHSSIETRRNRKTITSPFFNALIMRVHDASGLDSIDFEMHYDEPRPIWNDRKLELNITDFDPAIDYNQGDKVIYPINSAPGTPRYEIWRAINDTPAGAWNKNQWEKVSGNGYSFRGWFDPLDPNGGDDVSFNVINNSNDYSEGDYIISQNTGYYDFTAGQPTSGTAGIEVKEGERIAYMNKNWQIISPITDPVRMKGWFNPQMDSGDISQVEATVKNNSDVYTEGDYIIADRDGRYDFLNGVTGGSTSVTKDVHLGERWRYTNNAWVLASPAAAVPDRVRMKGWFDPADQDGGDDVDFPVFNNSTDYINGDYVISLNDGTYNFVTGRPDTTGTPIKEGERIQYYGGLWGSIDQTVILPKMVGWFDPTQDNGGPDVDEFIHNGGAFKRNDYVVATANGFYNFATGKSSATAGPAYSRIGGGQRWSYDGTNWNAVADAPTLFKGWFDPSQDDGGNRVPDSIQNTTPNYVDGSFIIAEGTGQYDFTNGTSVSAPNGTKVESGQIFRYNGAVWQLIGHQEDPNVIGFFNPTNDGGKGTVLHNIVNGTTDYRNGNYAIALSDGLYDFTTGQTDTGVAVGSPAPSGTRVPGGSRIVYDGTNWSVLSAGSGLSKGFMDPTVNNGGPGVNYPIVNGTIDYNGNEFVIVEKYGRYNFATGRPETLHATEPGLANGTLLRKNDVVIYDGAVWRSITGENTFYQHPMTQPGIENPNDDPDWSTNPDGYTFFITNTRVYKWVEDWTDEMRLGGGLTIPRTPPTWVPIYDVGLPDVWSGRGRTTPTPKDRNYPGMQGGQIFIGPDSVYQFHRRNPANAICYEVGEKFNIPTPVTAYGPTSATANGDFPNKAALDAVPADGTIKVNDVAVTLDDNKTWLYLGDNAPAGQRWKDAGMDATLSAWRKKFDFNFGSKVYFESIKEVPTGNPNDVPSLISALNKVGDHLVTDEAVWEWTNDLALAALWTEPEAKRLGHGETPNRGDPVIRGIVATETRLKEQFNIVDNDYSIDGDVVVTKDTGHAWIFEKGSWKDTGNAYSVPIWIKKFDLLTREVVFKNSFELNSDFTPLSTDAGEPGQYMITEKAVWKWVTDQKIEAQPIVASKSPTVGEWIGDRQLAPTTRSDGSSLQNGDYFVNNSYGPLAATIPGVPMAATPPLKGTSTGWVGSSRGAPPIDPLQVGVWSQDISLKINCANLPITLATPVTFTVYMSDRTTRTITLPADTYQHAGMIPPGTPVTEKSVGMTLANDPLFANELSGVMLEVEGGKTYLRVDGYASRADAVAAFTAMGAGAPPAGYGTLWPISVDKAPSAPPAVPTGVASSNSGGWVGTSTEPPVSANEYGYWLDISTIVNPAAAIAWTPPTTPHLIASDLYFDIAMSSGPAKYVKISSGSYSSTQDLGTNIKANLDAIFPGDFTGVFVTIDNGKVWLRLDTSNVKPRVIARAGSISSLTHNSRVYYYSAGNWVDSGIDVTSVDTFAKGGMWIKEFDTDIPVWDTTKAYRPGDMVLVPPPVGSTVWGMYKVNNAVTGATTIGQSPDATPTEWDQIGGGGAVTNIKFDDISTNPNSTAPWNTALNKVADDYLITPATVYKYVDNVLDVILIQTGVDIRTIDTTDATTMNALGWVETDYALTPNNYVGEFADANAFTTAAMGRSPATPGDWGIIDPVAGSNTAKVAYLNSAAPITPANPWVPVVDYIVGFTDGTKNLELIKYAGTTDITGWQKIMNLGSTASPDRYRSVADNAARIALNDPTDITDGALIHQKDTGKIWLYTNNNWEEYLPEHPNAMSGSPPAPTPGLQRLEYDGSKVIGDQIRWVDDRQSMTSVSNIPDLNDRTIILTTHLKRGKLVFVATTGEIYELINDPDDGTLTNTISDWRLATSGGITVYNRVADLPTPTAANNIREGNLALVRFHADAVTPLGDVFIARTGTTPGANKWEPIIREIFTKPLKTDPPVPDPMPRDIQVTTENGHKEIKIWDRTAGAWVLVYSEDSVKQWIAAGNLFVGTAEDTGHGTAGAIDLNVMPAENTLGANEKGHYWVFVGTAGYTILPNDIGGVTSAIEGQTLNVGDWIQVSEPTTGTFRYTVIPGDLLAKTRGDSLYGLNTWVAGAFESGTLISHQGGIYKANAAILITDPAPDDPTNTKWIKIPISAGVRNVAADNNLPATAPTGEVYLVLNSARAGGNPSFYIWDVASVQWIPIGGAGGGVPLNLGGGELIYNVGLPIGSVMMWPLDLPPDGWLICNGNVFDGVKYAVLNQLLGDNHTPDLRGQFIRGAVGPLDNFAKHRWTTGMPRTSFTTNNSGNHHHDYWDPRGAGGRGLKGSTHDSPSELFLHALQGPTWDGGNHRHTVTGGGDSETAPNHVYLNFIIKAEDQNLGRRII